MRSSGVSGKINEIGCLNWGAAVGKMRWSGCSNARMAELAAHRGRAFSRHWKGRNRKHTLFGHARMGGSQRTGEGREIWFMKYVPVVLDQETIRPPRVGREKYVTRRNERGKRGQSVPTATTGIQNLKAQKTSQPPPIITQ